MNSFWQEFRKPVILIVIVFLAFFVYTKLFGPIPFYINSVNTTKTDIFSSSGSGEATAVPDEATVNVGVTKSAATVEDAQKQANTVSQKLIADLKKLGINEKDIKTTNYSVNPSYQLGEIQPLLPRGGNQSGYEVTQNIEVKVKPIENANKVIDLATKDGANVIGGASFTFSDDLQKSLEEQATKMAVDDAKAKAQMLAKTSGIQIGRIINVVSGNTNPGPIYNMSTAAKAEDQGAPTTNVTPGQSSVNISVTIYYETF